MRRGLLFALALAILVVSMGCNSSSSTEGQVNTNAKGRLDKMKPAGQ